MGLQTEIVPQKQTKQTEPTVLSKKKKKDMKVGWGISWGNVR